MPPHELKRALLPVVELLKLAPRLEDAAECRDICRIAARRLLELADLIAPGSAAPTLDGARSASVGPIADYGPAPADGEADRRSRPHPLATAGSQRATLHAEEYFWRLRADLNLGSPLVARTLVRLLEQPGLAIPVDEAVFGRTPFKVVVVRLRRDLAAHGLSAAIVTVGRRSVSRSGGYLFDPAYLPRLQARLSFDLSELLVGTPTAVRHGDGAVDSSA